MTLEFVKMSGAGNDFILIDNRARTLSLSREQVVRLCHRQFGIGADGIMLLIPCASGKADWAWQFYNSDGSDAEMCGNGARCFARFIQKLTGAKDSTTFETVAGIITARFHNDRVTINLTAPHSLRLHETIATNHGTMAVHSLNTGVPHAVLFVPDLAATPVQALGSELRYHAHFKPRGTNVNFAQNTATGIAVRTYERGVEGETLACGTGVTATAIIASRVLGLTPPIQVRVQSGDTLDVNFAPGATPDSWTQVTLSGPATFVFEGRTLLPL